MAWRTVARLDELWEGEMRVVVAAGRRCVLVRAGDSVVAFEDRCAHLGVPISAGRLDAGVLTCSAHHWQYDACSGRGINPSSAALVRLPVRVEDRAVSLDVGEDA